MTRKTKTFGRPGPRTQNSRSATLETRRLRVRVLIYCEGKKTEPLYFRQFRIQPTVRELVIRGEGTNTLKLVEEAILLDTKEGPFDEIWCVFDRDSFPPANFDNAIRKIEGMDRFFAAYSNQAFELWFLLHFEFFDSALHREQYREKLSRHLQRRYEKNDQTVYTMIQTKGSETQAISRAERLLNSHPQETSFAERCPITTVHWLVQKLRRWEAASFPVPNS